MTYYEKLDEQIRKYSSRIGISLFAINEQGEIIAGIDHVNKLGLSKLFSIDCPPFSSKIPTFVTMSKTIKKPTIISMFIEYMELKLIITPIQLLPNRDQIFFAGPFLDRMDKQLEDRIINSSIPVIDNDKTIENLLKQMDEWLELIKYINKEETVRNYVYETVKLMDLFNTYSTLENECFISELLHKVFTLLKPIDFIGFAKKGSNEVFHITEIKGKNTKNLFKKQFYYGEGLLGQAAIEQKAKYWNRLKKSNLAFFFNEEQFYLDSLFCCPIKRDNQITGLLFGGSVDEGGIEKEIKMVFEVVANFIASSQQKEILIDRSSQCLNYLISFIDFISGMFSFTEEDQMIFRVMDFCQSINKGLCVFYTDYRGRRYNRGKMEYVERKHQVLAQDFFQRTSIKYEGYQTTDDENENYIHHQGFYHQNKKVGFLTFIFQDGSLLQEINQMFQVIIQLYNSSSPQRQNDSGRLDIEQKVTILFDSLKELKEEDYLFTKQLLKNIKAFCSKLNHSIREDLVENAAKVITFRTNFLKEKLAGSDEWLLLNEDWVLEKTNKPKKIEEWKLEYQILWMNYYLLKDWEKYKKMAVDSDLKEEFEHYFLLMNGKMKEKTQSSLTEEEEDEKKMKKVIEDLPLTVREKEVLFFVLEGLNNHEVANQLTISIHTVKNHLTNIFRKLDVTDRVQVMAKMHKIKTK
ncbi:MAG: LuxR C-terminal-related transcriptional regulator [Bacillus sp. (in: firmicutes)]